MLLFHIISFFKRKTEQFKNILLLKETYIMPISTFSFLKTIQLFGVINKYILTNLPFEKFSNIKGNPYLQNKNKINIVFQSR